VVPVLWWTGIVLDRNFACGIFWLMCILACDIFNKTCGRFEMTCGRFWHNLAHLQKNEFKLYFEVTKMININNKLN